MAITYRHGGVELLDTIGPLWERLRDHHAAVSPRFSEVFLSVDFPRRRAMLARKPTLRADLALGGGAPIGYVITTIDGAGTAEIESLYVEDAYRGRGIGAHLMRRALGWLEESGVERKIIGVAVGNERALPFYARFGFYPRTLLSQQRP